jgi:hypothetical protein
VVEIAKRIAKRERPDCLIIWVSLWTLGCWLTNATLLYYEYKNLIFGTLVVALFLLLLRELLGLRITSIMHRMSRWRWDRNDIWYRFLQLDYYLFKIAKNQNDRFCLSTSR